MITTMDTPTQMNHNAIIRATRLLTSTHNAVGAMILATLLIVSPQRMSAEESVISGHITGADGRPPIKASLEVFRYGTITPDTVIDAGTTGGFSIALPKRGVYKIRVSALHHESLSFPLLCNRFMREEIDVQLAPLRIPRRIDSVCAIGTFNGYSLSAPLRMEYKDGAYRAKLREVPPSTSWQVLIFGDSARPTGIRTSTVSKTGYTVVEGICAVRLDREGAAELRFDPSEIPQRNGQAAISSGNTSLQGFLRTAVELTDWRDRYQSAMEIALTKHRRSGGDNANFDVAAFRQRMGASSMEENIRERMRTAEDTLSEQLLYLSYLGLPGDTKDNALMERALRVIPPSSMMWSIDPSSMYVALNARKKDTKDQYINDVLTTNPSESVIVPIAYAECLQAQAEAQTSRQRELYTLLVKKYPHHPLTVSAKLYLNPDRKVKVGRTFPSITMMPCGATVPMSSALFKGMYTLIDMRTDRCGVCDNGFKSLLAQVKTLSGKPLRVISMNLGSDAAIIKEERSKNILVQSARLLLDAPKDSSAQSSNDSTADTSNNADEQTTTTDTQRAVEFMEFVGYPWRVLLNEDMEIVAMGSDLDDVHVAATLSALIQ